MPHTVREVVFAVLIVAFMLLALYLASTHGLDMAVMKMRH